MNDLRGSQWRKWDLHFHTPSSYDYQGKSITDEDIIKVLNQNKIEVIAITDHHIIDIPRINNLKKLGSELGITVLPGIEFLSDARGKDPIHFIGIFSENCNLEYIWGQIENTTNIKNIKGTGKKPNEVYCDLLETIKIIKELGGIVSIHAGDKSNSIENITNSLPQSIAQKTEIASIIDIYELGKESDQKGYTDIVFPAIKKIIPMIICSDNHDIDNYKLKQNCWIKADPTFEGLRQIIFEPEQRIFIGENPLLRHKKLKIDSFSIVNSSKFQLENQEIFLNNNMVSIIGGRGSGKSAFLETLTFCFGKNKQPAKWDFSDSEILNVSGDYLHFLKKSGANAKLIIKYSDLDNNKLQPYIKEIQDNNENYCDFPLIYLGQNQIEHYSNSPSKIHELAYEAVLKNSGLADEISSIQTEIKAYEAELISLTKDIESSRLQLLSYNIDKIKMEKVRLEKEIALLSSAETKTILEKLSKSRLKKDNYTKAISIAEKINSDFKKISIDFDTRLKELNNTLPTIGIEKRLEFDFKIAITNTEEILEILGEVGIIEEHEVNIIEAEQQLEGKTEVTASYFDALKSRIEEIESTLQLYIKEEEYLESNIKYRYTQIDEFGDLFTELNELYTNATAIFTKSNSGILKSLKLESATSFSSEKLIHDLFDMTDKRKIKDINKFKTEILKITNTYTASEYSEWLKKFESDETNFNYFNDGKKTFEEVAYKNYFTLETKIFYEVEPNNYRILTNLSLGQKGTVLLKLFLSLGNNCPIIIDQPEDHLDNHFIYSDLVSTLKKAKEKRQVILVTHDANIVVNGDSEQVIVAEYKNNNINYSLSGSIENPLIKEAMTKILEGGNEAFIKRESKYQIKTK
ncbi:MAG: hypothetical protein Q7W45_13930 [Bacteroidota bacterium]|nr:hypothetical protein [Bacteroidota bacterium]MDP3144378.1 hypothetical protein [Bacteroidota bacterium]